MGDRLYLIAVLKCMKANHFQWMFYLCCFISSGSFSGRPCGWISQWAESSGKQANGGSIPQECHHRTSKRNMILFSYSYLFIYLFMLNDGNWESLLTLLCLFQTGWCHIGGEGGQMGKLWCCQQGNCSQRGTCQITCVQWHPWDETERSVQVSNMTDTHYCLFVFWTSAPASTHLPRQRSKPHHGPSHRSFWCGGRAGQGVDLPSPHSVGVRF